MATRPRWYSSKDRKTVDAVGVPLEDSSRSTQATGLKAKRAANDRVAAKEPSLKAISALANEGLDEQLKDLRAARQETRSAVRMKDAKTKRMAEGGKVTRKDNMPDWAKQVREDEKAKPKQDKAYNDSMVNTPAAPKKKYAKGGSVRGAGCAVKGTSKAKMY